MLSKVLCVLSSVPSMTEYFLGVSLIMYVLCMCFLLTRVCRCILHTRVLIVGIVTEFYHSGLFVCYVFLGPKWGLHYMYFVVV